MSKKSSGKEHDRNRKAGDLNRKSSHELRSNDGMALKGYNPYTKMMGLSKKKEI